MGSVTQTVPISVVPAFLESVSATPSSFVGGSTTVVTGTVTLAGLVATKPVTVKLKSSNTKAVKVPGSVVVKVGNDSVNFVVSHLKVTSTESVTITATYGTATQTTVLTVNPFVITSFSISPATVPGGKTSEGYLTLNAVPKSAVLVKLISNSKAVIVPVGVNVPANATSETFKITTKAVGTVTTATVTAGLGTQTEQATLTVEPPVLETVKVAPATVKGSSGSPVIGTVTISGDAPGGGLPVSLTSSDPTIVTVPAVATVASGRTSVTFKVTHKTVTTTTDVTITATLAGVSVTTTLTVTP